MKVRMLKTAAGSWGVWNEGDEVDVDQDMAAGLVAAGAAKALEPFDIREPDPEVEIADLVPEAEIALAPRIRRRRGR